MWMLIFFMVNIVLLLSWKKKPETYLENAEAEQTEDSWCVVLEGDVFCLPDFTILHWHYSMFISRVQLLDIS